MLRTATVSDTTRTPEMGSGAIPEPGYLGVNGFGEYSYQRSALPNYVGITAVFGEVNLPNLYHHAGVKRADVYIDEKHFLPEGARDPIDGTESDEDDERSIHIVVSRRGPNGKGTEVLGLERAIVKRSEDDLLPVERYFDIPPAPVGSMETSRFIARSPNRVLQGRVSLALMRAMSFLGVEQKAPYIYAVTEEPFFRQFQAIGVPFEPLTDLQWLDEYRSKNRALQLKPNMVIPAIREKDKIMKRVGRDAIAPFFSREERSKGLGHYTDSF